MHERAAGLVGSGGLGDAVDAAQPVEQRARLEIGGAGRRQRRPQPRIFQHPPAPAGVASPEIVTEGTSVDMSGRSVAVMWSRLEDTYDTLASQARTGGSGRAINHAAVAASCVAFRAMAATEHQKDGQHPPAPRPPRYGAWQVARIMGVPIYLTASWILLAVIIIVGYGPYAGAGHSKHRRLRPRPQHRRLPAAVGAAARTRARRGGTAVPRRRPRHHPGTARRFHRDGQRGADAPGRSRDRARRAGGLLRHRDRHRGPGAVDRPVAP